MADWREMFVRKSAWIVKKCLNGNCFCQLINQMNYQQRKVQMQGAREYYDLFKSRRQYGKLYISVGSHARGYTLDIWIVPRGEEFKPIHGRPTNRNAVQVYGAIGGQLGWSEVYGWMHDGPWVEDFNNLVEQRKKEIAKEEKATAHSKEKAAKEENDRIQSILLKY